MTKPSRNDPCPCGSGKKYKKCCGAPKSAKKFTAQVLQSGSTVATKIASLKDRVSSKTTAEGENALDRMKKSTAEKKDNTTENS